MAPNSQKDPLDLPKPWGPEAWLNEPEVRQGAGKRYAVGDNGWQVVPLSKANDFYSWMFTFDNYWLAWGFAMKMRKKYGTS